MLLWIRAPPIRPTSNGDNLKAGFPHFNIDILAASVPSLRLHPQNIVTFLTYESVSFVIVAKPPLSLWNVKCKCKMMNFPVSYCNSNMIWCCPGRPWSHFRNSRYILMAFADFCLYHTQADNHLTTWTLLPFSARRHDWLLKWLSFSRTHVPLRVPDCMSLKNVDPV